MPTKRGPSFGVRPRNDKFQGYWRDEQGIWHGKVFPLRAQALTFARTQALTAFDILAGRAIKEKPLNEALEAFLNREDVGEPTHDLNRRRMEEFIEIFSLEKVDQITEDVINTYLGWLKKQGHNKGGQHHHLKIVKAFIKFCLRKKWLSESPFTEEFKMPRSEFVGKNLTAEERERFLYINPKYPVDIHLNRILNFGFYTMLRISQVFRIQTEDFRAPNQLRTYPIKGQEPRWVTLHPEAVKIISSVMEGKKEGDRLLSGYWDTLDAMREAVHKKAKREKLAGVRFHETKHSGISTLLNQGYSAAEVELLTNTNRKTIISHYSHANERETLQKFVQFRYEPRASYGHQMELKSSNLDPISVPYELLQNFKLPSENLVYLQSGVEQPGSSSGS